MKGLVAGVLAFLGLASAPEQPVHPPAPPKGIVVSAQSVADQKAVFATVESANVVPARARIGGTIAALGVRQGDHVEQGQPVASIGDAKLGLQVSSYGAQVQAAQAQLAQARVEFERAKKLIAAGAISQNAFDQARTAYNVAASNVKSISSQRAVVSQTQSEGQVLAPTSGRVITVPVTAGTVVMPGDIIATVAEQNFVLRLEIPERHARFLKVGDRVRLDGADIDLKGPRFGTIKLVYPQVENGHVVADAVVEGIKDYFVGQRVRVWVSAGERKALVVPSGYIVTRFGIDYARVWSARTGAMDVPVQLGQPYPTPAIPNGVEILSGLKAGDRLLKP